MQCSYVRSTLTLRKLFLTATVGPSEFPDDGGVRSLRARGTCFIAHKVCALERILERFGAYLNQFAYSY